MVFLACVRSVIHLQFSVHSLVCYFKVSVLMLPTAILWATRGIVFLTCTCMHAQWCYSLPGLPSTSSFVSCIQRVSCVTSCWVRRDTFVHCCILHVLCVTSCWVRRDTFVHCWVKRDTFVHCCIQRVLCVTSCWVRRDTFVHCCIQRVLCVTSCWVRRDTFVHC